MTRAKAFQSVLCCTLAVFVEAPVGAQETPYAKINAAAAASPITVTPLRDGISWLEGSGGNMVALNGPQGIFMVDDGIAVSKAKIAAELHRIGPGPLRYVVNTHWHWDHTDGNVWTGQAGATLIGQRNTAKHLADTIEVVEWGHVFTPEPPVGRIAMLVDDQQVMTFGKETIELRHYVPSHTDGDLSVYFHKGDVLATGDTYWNGMYPFIDYVAGGSIDGMIAAAKANVEKCGPHTIVVPGHGPLATCADLVAFRDMLVTVRSTVAALKGQGKSLDEVIAAAPSAQYDASWGKAVISPALFAALVYRGV